MIPSIGRIVHYRLTESDAQRVNQRRAGTVEIRELRDFGRTITKKIHEGNPVSAGDVFPMMITKIWGQTEESAVQGQVFLDGNDTLWVTSVAQATEADVLIATTHGKWYEAPRVPPAETAAK